MALPIHSDGDPGMPRPRAVRLAGALTEAEIAAEMAAMRSDRRLTEDPPPAEPAHGHDATRACLTRHGALAGA